MTIRANRTRAFMKMFLIFFVAHLLGGIVFSQVKPLEIGFELHLFLAAYAASFLALCCSLACTPKEIRWDDEQIIIWTRFPGYGNYRWQQLEYCIPGMKFNLFSIIIKFEGQLPYMILSLGYTRADWVQLRQIIGKKRS